MKLLIAFTLFIIVVNAQNLENKQLYDKYNIYLKCVSKHINELTKENNCEAKWKKYREEFEIEIELLEYCNYVEDQVKAEQ